MASNNPYYIQPANGLQALMIGVEAFDKSKKAAQEAEQRAAYQEIGQQIQSGGLDKTALGRLFGIGPAAAPMLAAAATFGKADTTDEIKEYNLSKAQGFTGSFTDWKTSLKKAGASNTTVNVDNKGEAAFESEFGKDQAKRWAGYMTGGETAQKKLVDIQSLREIGNRIGSQGVQAGIKDVLGPYAEAVGVNIEGLSDIQAYNSIITRLAPQQRVAGSGATSDIEYQGMVKAMPGLMQNPAARELTINTMEALERHDVAKSQIASRLATKEITRGQAEKELRALGDPMANFSTWRKANPQVYGAALKGASVQTPAGPAPAAAGQPAPQAAPQGGPVRPRNKAEKDALLPGTEYIAPDGSLRTRQ